MPVRVAANTAWPSLCTLLRSSKGYSSRTATISAAIMAGAEAAPERVKIALCQMNVTADKDENIQTAQRYVEDAAEQGANIVVLPEMWNCPYSNDSFPTYAEDIAGGASKSFKAISATAKAMEVMVIAGSIPERQEDKLFNTCCIFDTDGSLLGSYRKTHLFDIDIPGKITFKESDTLTPGSELGCLTTRYGTIGIGICYDLRFPELSMAYRKMGAQLLVFPGAFNMTTGPAHWQLLQQSRAVDNQLFVCSCSPARDLDAKYTAWGHSMAVGPFGEVLGQLADEPDILLQTLELSEIAERRQNMPLVKQRRADLYELASNEP
eukprot:jgi/Ulvmu1/11246/UM073_0018.1